MVKALADRLAEAFAECLHAQRARDWGYGPDEQLTQRGARSPRSTAASGRRSAIPACPDHTEKGTLFELLDAPARRASS